MRFRRASRHALGLHCFAARHRGQPRESLGHHDNGADPGHQGCVESHGMPGGSKPFHHETRRKGVTIVSTSKEGRAFFLDPRGRGSARKAEENADIGTRLGPTSTCRTAAPLRCVDDLGRQRSGGGRKAGGGTCATSPEASLFCQRGAFGDQGTLSLLMQN